MQSHCEILFGWWKFFNVIRGARKKTSKDWRKLEKVSYRCQVAQSLKFVLIKEECASQWCYSYHSFTWFNGFCKPRINFDRWLTSLGWSQKRLFIIEPTELWQRVHKRHEGCPQWRLKNFARFRIRLDEFLNRWCLSQFWYSRLLSTKISKSALNKSWHDHNQDWWLRNTKLQHLAFTRKELDLQWWRPP